MNNEIEFKFLVSGPYSPVSFDTYRRIQVVTVTTVLELANLYSSILQWRGHKKSMSMSMHHAEVMMGEVDEPIEQDEYNPIATAGFFGIMLACSLIGPHSTEEIKSLNKSSKIGAIAVITQLMFALTKDNDALAQYVRYHRTGFLGSPSSQDINQIEKIRKFVRSIASRAEQFEENFMKGQYDIPLQTRFFYDRDAKMHYWSAPIVVPDIEFEDEY